MESNANEVQAALEGVLDDAESQSAETQTPEVAEALKAALEPDEESAPDELDDKSVKESKEPKTVPYDRLSQVVKKKNELSEQLKALDTQYKAATARENELRTQVGNLETDKQILDAIKNLAQDDRYRPAVEQIDRALQGLDEDIEEAKEQGDNKAESAALKQFEAKTAELEEMLAEQRAESLLGEATGRAKEMLAALPEAYTDEDRAIIGKLWNPRVDWNGIEETGSEAIPGALNRSFAEVIKEYGTPRGALVAKTTKEIEDRIPEAKIVSDEDAVKGLLEKDWAETAEDGSTVHSEDDFVQGMAELLRRTRAG